MKLGYFKPTILTFLEATYWTAVQTSLEDTSDQRDHRVFASFLENESMAILFGMPLDGGEEGRRGGDEAQEDDKSRL